MCWAISRALVAAGEGALRTWIWRGAVWMTKPLLEALRAGAQTPEQRAMAALLSVRAADGSGDTDTAQTHVLAALVEHDDLVLALRDAAGYAADRGDAAAADAFLCRARDLGRAPTVPRAEQVARACTQPHTA